MTGIPTVSVVITTFNRRHGLDAVIAPLLADPATSEVLVVVDHCHDGSIEWARDQAERDPRVVPIWAERNLGQPEARALGVREALSEVVLSLDDDVVPDPGLVTGHAERQAGVDGLVVLGYMPVLLPDRRGARDFASFHYSTSYEEHVDIYERDPDRYVLSHFWAGNFSLRRHDFLRAVDGWDLDTPYHEDRLLGWLLQRAGLRGVFDRQLSARHHYDRPWAGWIKDGLRIGEASVLLRARHPDLVKRFDEDDVLRGYSALPSMLIRASDRPRARPLIFEGLGLANRIAGEARAWSLQNKLMVLARHISQRHGVRSASRQ